MLSAATPSTFAAPIAAPRAPEAVGPARAKETAPACADGAEGPAERWFPTDHLFAAVATGPGVRDLLLALDDQARLLDDLLAACATGAAVLPPALLVAARAVAAARAAGRGGLPA